MCRCDSNFSLYTLPHFSLILQSLPSQLTREIAELKAIVRQKNQRLKFLKEQLGQTPLKKLSAKLDGTVHTVTNSNA